MNLAWLLAFFLNWDSPHARMDQPQQGMELQEKETKEIRHTGNLFRKNLQLKDIC